jgi:bifunctional DNase/RNase
MLELRVKGICRCPRHPVPSIVLEDPGGARVLAIGIPLGETERIAHELGRTPACREPSIFTALLEALRFLGAKGLTPWLDLRGGELVGAIGLGLPGRGEAVIPCAPRDVAVVASLTRIPVSIGEALAREIEAAESRSEECGGECQSGITGWLEQVRPEDFA